MGKKSRGAMLVAAIAAFVGIPVALAAAATASRPTAVTGPAVGVTQSTATITGTINPHGHGTIYRFSFGRTPHDTSHTPRVNAGAGTADVAATANLTGLTPNTLYYYRIGAKNSGGVTVGANKTFRTAAAPAPPPSHVAFLGREGFVSPGGIIGVEAGCFGGDTGCGGHVTMSHDGVVIGQRDFAIAPNSGGFQNIGLNAFGKQALRQNGVFHLLAVDVVVTTTSGQRTSQVMHLARWVWH